MTEPISFDEARLFLTAERDRIEAVEAALIEGGARRAFDPRRRRAIGIIGALLQMVDDRQSSRAGPGVGVINSPLAVDAGLRKAWLQGDWSPQSGEGNDNARNVD